MKRSRFILLALIAFFLINGCSSTKNAAEKADVAKLIQQKVESGDFTFVANFASSLEFKNVNLTSYYDFKVKNDTIKANLPYFGRAYIASYNSTEGGINFTCTKFDYTIKSGKRSGNWLINIKTLDTDRTYNILIDCWETGNATLTVNDPNRQSIYFSGEILTK
jgi:hypothetical protein